MIRTVTIANFRGIKQGELTNLTNLVVLVGPNNTGKSTVLDALLVAAHPDPTQGLQLVLARRPSLAQPHTWLLWRQGRDVADTATISVETDSGKRRFVEIFDVRPHGPSAHLVASNYYQEDSRGQPNPSAQPSRRPQLHSPPLEDIPEVRLIAPYAGNGKTPLHDLYTQVAERGLRREAKAIVTDLLPEVQDIEILTHQNQPVVYLVFAHGAQPASLAGDGVRLLLQQSFELAAPRGGLILLEEPEVHMHPAAIRQSVRAIFAAVRRGIQIVLTTHSLDLIDALLEGAAEGELEKLALYRLQLSAGQLRSHRLSGQEVALARTQIEDDLR